MIIFFENKNKIKESVNGKANLDVGGRLTSATLLNARNEQVLLNTSGSKWPVSYMRALRRKKA